MKRREGNLCRAVLKELRESETLVLGNCLQGGWGGGGLGTFRTSLIRTCRLPTLLKIQVLHDGFINDFRDAIQSSAQEFRLRAVTFRLIAKRVAAIEC